MTVEEFKVDIPDGVLDDRRERLRATRWADDFNNEDWRYGIPGSYLRELVDYWLNEFDWRKQETEINRLRHFRTVIDEVPIHFIHERGRGKRVLPLILSHGWPWTFWDFGATIGPLTNPASFGLSDEIAFDVVVPSLPGFGFSSPLRKSGVSAAVTADLWTRLMSKQLGYDRFGAHGGDWGAFVTANLAHAHSDKVIGAHMSLAALLGIGSISDKMSGPNDTSSLTSTGRFSVTAADYAPEEAGWYDSWTTRMSTTARAHSIVHRESPQTLAFALTDSPVGLAAWLIEKRRNWSDNDGNVETAFSKDFLLTSVSIYDFTRTIGTSMRAYADFGLDTWQPRHDRTPVIEAPVGIAVMPKDLLLLPKTMYSRYANLVRWTVMPAGGHFAAAEQPALIVDDIRKFFSELG